MKKFLLFVCCACSAMAMNAQVQATVTTFKPSGLNVERSASMSVMSKAQVQMKEDAKALNSYTHAVSSRFKAPTNSALSGFYLEDTTEDGKDNQDYEYSVIFTNPVTLGVQEVTEDGETYNEVSISGIFQGLGTDVTGYYFPEEGKILIPAQEIGDTQYGPLMIIALDDAESMHMKLIAGDDGEMYYDAMEFDVIEDGSDLYIQLADAGWATLIMSGQYAGQGYAFGFDCTLNAPNGTLYHSLNELDETGENFAGWEAQEELPVYVENYGDVIIFHNFPSVLFNVNVCLTATLNDEDGLFYVEEGADIAPTSSYGMTSFYNNSQEGGDIPVFETNGNFFFGTPAYDEAGELVEGSYYPAYMYPGPKSTGGETWFGVVIGRIEISNQLAEGVNSVLAPEFSKASFNLAGQRVNKANGLVIESGKKVIR